MDWSILPLPFSVHLLIKSLRLVEDKDYMTHAKLSDQLLHHFTQSFRDREVYWLARERSKVQKDILVMILDTFDHAKLSLPKWHRTPKRALYKNTRRTLDEHKIIVFQFFACEGGFTVDLGH